MSNLTASPMLGLSIHELKAELERSEKTIGKLIVDQSDILRSLDFYVQYTEAVRSEIAFRQTAYTPTELKPVTLSMIEMEKEITSNESFAN